MAKDRKTVAVADPLPCCKDSPCICWGVQDDKGNWAFANGAIICYPCKAVADAHAGTLSPRWKAVAFGA